MTTREWNLSNFVGSATYADDGLANAFNEIESQTVSIPGYGVAYGGVLHVDGLFRLAGGLRREVPQGTHVLGFGRATGFVYEGVGDCLAATNQPGNAGASDVEVSRLGIYRVPGSTGRAALMFLGGGSSVVRDVYTSGWDWGCVLDACNHVTLERCHFNGSSVPVGTGGVWFVDGPTLNPASVNGATNANWIRDCLFNVATGVQHDGGVANVIHGHWNAPGTAVLIRGSSTLSISGSVEGATENVILLEPYGNEVAISALDLRVRNFYNTGPVPALRYAPTAHSYGLDAEIFQAGGSVVVDNGPYAISGAVRALITNWSPSGTTCFVNELIGGDTAVAQCWTAASNERKCTGIGTVKPTWPGLHVYSTVGDAHLP